MPKLRHTYRTIELKTAPRVLLQSSLLCTRMHSIHLRMGRDESGSWEITIRKMRILVPLVEELRFRGFCRKIAYQKFKDLRKNQMLPGCGPAYFTKFIFFMNGGKKSNPQHNGFIMDQWTVKSIQLLTGERRPYLSSAGYVNDDNTDEDYEFYCHTIEELASKLRFQDPDMAEEAIFSNGGKNSGAWRRYVKRNWHSP